MSDLLGLRLVLVAILALAGWFTAPLGLPPAAGAALGLGAAVFAVYAESRLRSLSLARLIGGAIGSLLGMLGALLISLVLDRSPLPGVTPFAQLAILAVMTYCGIVIGTIKGDALNLAAFGGLFGGEPPRPSSVKILDTSVIIDGRIADIATTGFLDGIVVIPQFVLRELQHVADSPDGGRRQRGRHGLDVLKKLQAMPALEIRLVDDDFPQVKEVDLKLLELAKATKAKVVTNDFNLNKVAQVHGVEVLNINELANSLKPVVLPGETMRVFILKEGKEAGQGVAYLDDGTMVVVDNARKQISKTVDVTVTSVLQTTAGKMIFGKYE